MNKTKFKKIIEKTIELILGSSSIVTSITVLLIIGFLFKEGSDVFDKKPIEEGYVLAVNPNNPVNQIKPSEVKDIFDQKITNWNQIKGGKNEAIKLLRIDDITKYYDEDALGANFEHLPAKIDEFTKNNPGVIIFISETYLSKNFYGKEINIDKIQLKSFLQGEQWFPTAQPIAQMGVKPLILGTLWVSIGAIVIALPIGLGVSIYLSEIATKKVRNILKPIIELLAAIPSVVYGFFGLVVLVPLVQQIFNLPVGETGLSGSIILAIMALPTIITVSEDAMRNTPRSMKEASLALGATHWQTIYKVIIPYASS